MRMRNALCQNQIAHGSAHDVQRVEKNPCLLRTSHTISGCFQDKEETARPYMLLLHDNMTTWSNIISYFFSALQSGRLRMYLLESHVVPQARRTRRVIVHAIRQFRPRVVAGHDIATARTSSFAKPKGSN